MMQYDQAALRVLFLGGTGTISTSCVRLAIETGMEVFVLNRGRNSAARHLPDGVTWLTGDVADDASLSSALGDLQFDAVVNFLSYDVEDVRRAESPVRGPHQTVRAHQLRLDLCQAGAADPDRRVDPHRLEPAARLRDQRNGGPN